MTLPSIGWGKLAGNKHNTINMPQQTKEKKLLKEFRRNLRKHMGFGHLDKHTICIEDGKCYAEYYDEFGNKTHTIEFDGEYYDVRQQQGDEPDIWSSHSSLQHSFMVGFQHANLAENRHFHTIKKYMEQVDNIFVQPPHLAKGTSNQTYYPYGVLFNIHLILTSKNRHMISQFQQGK